MVRSVVSWCNVALLAAIFLVDVTRAACPPPGDSLCNCTEVLGKSNELLVACDGMASVPDLKYQLDGIPAAEIVELAVLRTKNWQGLRSDFFNEFKSLTRLGLAANPNSNFKLPLGIFEKIGKQILTLDLSTCNLTEKDLSPELLAPLVNLKDLDLSWNQITQIRASVFAAVPSVTTIDLGDNKLTTLPPYLFAQNRNLTMLDLNDNLLTELPKDLFEDQQFALKILDIGGNRISKLTSDHFVMMPNLTVLDARKNPISVLPSDLFSKTPQLARISLNGIQAAVVPPSLFRGLPLESLDLSNADSVRSYPEGLLSTVGSTLKELHLDNSPNLFSLPPKFFNGLVSLDSLDISNTGLDLLPSTFFTDLKSLRKLKISNNPWLISLPPPKDFSPDLKIIDAKNCPKLPPVVTKWINNNFDSRTQLMDFPINIYRSVNREILLRMIPVPATTTAAPTTTTVRPPRPQNNNDDWANKNNNNNNNGGGRNNNNNNNNNGNNNGGRWNSNNDNYNDNKDYNAGRWNNNNNNNNNNGGRWNSDNNGGNAGRGNNNNNGGRGNNNNFDSRDWTGSSSSDNNNNNNNGGGWGWGR